jgi:hypothetical protein
MPIEVPFPRPSRTEALDAFTASVKALGERSPAAEFAVLMDAALVDAAKAAKAVSLSAPKACEEHLSEHRCDHAEPIGSRRFSQSLIMPCFTA